LNKYPPPEAQSNLKNEDPVRTTQSSMTSRHAQSEPEIALKYPMSHSKRPSQDIPRPQQTRDPSTTTSRCQQSSHEMDSTCRTVLSERTYVCRPSRCASATHCAHSESCTAIPCPRKDGASVDGRTGVAPKEASVAEQPIRSVPACIPQLPFPVQYARMHVLYGTAPQPHAATICKAQCWDPVEWTLLRAQCHIASRVSDTARC
jgi:hypothetical protein